MLDYVFYGLKILVMFTAALSLERLANGKSSGHLSFILIGVAIFMTGMEMITHSETPWQFLLTKANVSDWQKAILGGSVMLMLPVILYVLVGKGVQKSINKKDRKY